MDPRPRPAPDLTALANQGLGPVAAAIEAHYEDLRELARRLMRRESPGLTLQPTALVHEVAMRMLRPEALTSVGEANFLAAFAVTCRALLIDEARRRRAEKRGGGTPHLSLTGTSSALGVPGHLGVIEIEDLLLRLGRIDARLEQIVEMRVFAGMTEAQCAAALDVSVRTVAKDWKLARDWLRRELAGHG